MVMICKHKKQNDTGSNESKMAKTIGSRTGTLIVTKSVSYMKQVKNESRILVPIVDLLYPAHSGLCTGRMYSLCSGTPV